jgi:hypothetical protein
MAFPNPQLGARATQCPRILAARGEGQPHQREENPWAPVAQKERQRLPQHPRSASKPVEGIS